uniref:Uncharacterized protein n=1 Tax=Oryza punctata TaxID=4537 RepID=A0A0E0JIP6_ORYPU
MSDVPAVEPLILAHVIQDVLDPFRPTMPLRITYNDRLLLAGAELKHVSGTDLTVFYTLVLVDPDVPSPSNPSLREYLHWMVIDIPGTTGVSFGQELMLYEIPEPRYGIHRMFFHQTYDTTSIAEALHNNTIWTLWLLHISTAKGSRLWWKKV